MITLKICFIANITSIHTLRMANHFSNNGLDIEIISWRGDKNKYTYNSKIKIHKLCFPPHSIFRYLAVLELYFKIRKIKPDVIHAHYVTTKGFVALLYNSFFHPIPLMISAMGSDVLLYSHNKNSIFFRRILNNADCYTYDSSAIAEELVNIGVDEEKLLHFYWGIDTKKFLSAVRDPSLRDSYGGKDRIIVISSKPLSDEYDIKTTLLAAQKTLAIEPDVRFIIAGEGDRKNEYENWCDKNGLKERIFFPGYIPSDEYPNFLASSDIYVCSTPVDGGLAISTKEAMVCNLPVIVTDNQENLKWIKHHENGLIFTMGDPDSLSKQICWLIHNKDEREEIAQRGKQMVLENFEYGTEMNKILKKYIELSKQKQVDF